MITATTAAGPLLFVRYAMAPNLLGYCGPDDAGALITSSVRGAVDEVRDLARQFESAWPCLQLIARAAGLDDPLDQRVVEAYWIGSPLLDDLGAMFAAGGRPHHSYQVFCVYPWVALLGDGRASGQALHVLDQCRIRWGRVVADTGSEVVVESRPLTWSGQVLALGPLRRETVRRHDLLDPLAPGEWVSLHWQWVCDRLTAEQLTALRGWSAYHLTIANTGLTLG
ncbi:DUF6390 family protein [Kribbella italica]|uniref:Uncharacterized protein n=1 Tax=Kribbella italica TaxID=1540520 RepID=A0A7W9JF12_9ACTN|nr:DUF6390 family protein [Kribbella italica]MBB5840911.1 hypothetical protein [Kribbella italica]